MKKGYVVFYRIPLIVNKISDLVYVSIM